MLKPSEMCKAAGLTSLAEFEVLTGTSRRTLINWHKSKQDFFQVLLLGAVAKKNDGGV